MGVFLFFYGGIMQEKFNQLKIEAKTELETVQSLKDLNDLKVKYIRKSAVIFPFLPIYFTFKSFKSFKD